VDRTLGFVNGQTRIPVKTTSPGCHGPAAAPGVEVSPRRLLTVTIKRTFIIIIPLRSITEGRQSRRSACLNTVSGVPTPVGHTPATGSAAPRQWRPGPDGGQATASCRPISRCAPRGHHGSRSKPTRVERQRAAAVFCSRGHVIVAGWRPSMCCPAIRPCSDAPSKAAV
jgi:hypothetical protein